MSKSKKSAASDRLEFAKALNGLTAKQDAFIKAVEAVNTFNAETLQRLDMEIDDKKQELEELSKQFERLKKDGQIETDQLLAEHKYNGALQILSELDEVPIKSSELTQLRAELEKLRSGHEAELEAALKAERTSSQKALQMAIRSKDLEHKAEIAELSAGNKQLTNEITSLHNAISNLKEEIAAQRDLTREVAQASAKSQISQSFGKQ